MGRLRWSMAHLSMIARRQGYDAFNFEYRSRSGPISKHAADFLQFLNAHVSPSTPLYFVTHSLGSIILRELVARHPTSFNYKRAVMLGPPNQGSQSARILKSLPGLRWYFGEPFRELAGNAFATPIENLEIGIIAGVLSHTRAVSLWYSEPNDGLVSVTETRLEGSRDHRIIRCPHAVLMYSPKVLKETFYFLKHGTVTPS